MRSKQLLLNIHMGLFSYKINFKALTRWSRVSPVARYMLDGTMRSFHWLNLTKKMNSKGCVMI